MNSKKIIRTFFALENQTNMCVICLNKNEFNQLVHDIYIYILHNKEINKNKSISVFEIFFNTKEEVNIKEKTINLCLSNTSFEIRNIKNNTSLTILINTDNNDKIRGHRYDYLYDFSEAPIYDIDDVIKPFIINKNK